MSSFAFYFLIGLVREAGWPRKGGFLGRKEVINSLVLDSSGTTLMRLGVCCGAEDPELSARIIAHSFQKRAWEQDGSDDLFRALLDGTSAEYAVPWQSLGPASFTPVSGKPISLPWQGLGDDRIVGIFVWSFARCVLWARSHPEAARRALERDHTETLRRLPEMLRAGLNVDPDVLSQSSADTLQGGVDPI